MAMDDETMIGVLCWRQRQLVVSQQPYARRALLCAAQIRALLLHPLLVVNEPRYTPTRLPRLNLSAHSDDDCILRLAESLVRGEVREEEVVTLGPSPDGHERV